MAIDISAKITGIKYTPFLCRKLKTYNLLDFDNALSSDATFILKVDEKIENLIEKQASETEVQSFAIANGMVTMQQDGILKALRGITTLEEVERVTGIIKRH